MVLKRFKIFTYLLVTMLLSPSVFAQGNRLFITALDEEQKPIPKVEVVVDSLYAGVTLPDGKLIISMKNTDDPRHLKAVKNGFEYVDWKYDTLSRNITVNMRTTRIIKGIVKSKKGNLPIPNIEVLLVDTRAPAAMTDAQGRFEIKLPDDVSPNTVKTYAVYNLGLQSSDFEFYERDGISIISLQQIPARRVLAVKIVDNQSGQPISGKTLVADSKETTSNEDGIVRLPYALTTKYEYNVKGYDVIKLTYDDDTQFLIARVQQELQNNNEKIGVINQKGDTILVDIGSFRQLATARQDSIKKKNSNLKAEIKELQEKLRKGTITAQEEQRLKELNRLLNINIARLDSIKYINDQINSTLTAKIELAEQRERNAKQEAEKRRLANEKQRAEGQRNILIFASIAIILLLLAIAFFIFNRRNRKQNKLLGEKVDEINKQKRVLEESSRILDQKNGQLKNQQQELERQHTKITDSIRYALTIQEAILPAQENIAQIFQDYFILYKPKDIVAGDFYWFAQKGNSSIISAIDCTGHGVPGGFMTMIGNTLLNQIVKEDGITDPKEVLTQLNVKVKETLKEQVKDEGRDGDGMDLGIINFDMTNSTATFCGAKTPLFYVKSGEKELAYIKGTNISIGSTLSRKKKEFTSHTINFEKGDIFYLASDGFQDQLGGPNTGKQKFLKKNFISLIEEVSSLPMEEQAQKFDEALAGWQGSGDQTDDIVILGLKV